jgi:type II secretory pathway predicted ATPase ExeA
MKPQPRGLALLRCMSPVAAEAGIRAVGGSSGSDRSRHARLWIAATLPRDPYSAGRNFLI